MTNIVSWKWHYRIIKTVSLPHIILPFSDTAICLHCSEQEKGSDCLLHSAERSQSSCVNPQRAEGWTAVRVCLCVCVCVQWTSETVFRITEMDMPLTHQTRSERQQRHSWSTDFLFLKLAIVIPITYTSNIILYMTVIYSSFISMYQYSFWQNNKI